VKAKNTLRCEQGKRHCSKTRRLGGMNNKQAAVRLAMGCTPQRAYMARRNSVIILNSSSRLSEIRRAAVSTAVSIQKCNMNCKTYARFLKRQRPRVAPLNFERGNEERDKSVSNLPVCGYAHRRAWRCGRMNSFFLLLPMRARLPPSHAKCMFDSHAKCMFDSHAKCMFDCAAAPRCAVEQCCGHNESL